MEQYSNLTVHGKIKQKTVQGTESDDVVLYGTTETANTFLGRVPAALPKPANDNNGKAIISNGSGFEFGEAGKVDQVQVNGTAIAGDGTSTKIANIVPGTGLTNSGGTINHSNSITANTSGVGSTTKIPVIKYDAQGHITSTSTVTVYPPTSVGTSGQIWQSDGNGVGTWQTLDTTPTASSTKAVTSGGIKTYVDNQVLLNTANFLGTFDVEDDLGLPETATHAQVETKLGQMTWSPTPTKNDYVYIQFDLSSDPGVIDRYERYQYTGSAWAFILEIQNPSFDTNQWAAINSGITSTKVGTYDTHIANTKIHVPTTTTAGMILTSANNAAPTWATIKQDGLSGTTVTRYAVCDTAALTQAKTANVTNGTFTLETGARVTVKFTNTNTSVYSPTLNINGTGAKSIYCGGIQVQGTLYGPSLLSGIKDFVYDGTNWVIVDREHVLATTSNGNFPLLIYANPSIATSSSNEGPPIPDMICKSVYVIPSTGTIYATAFNGDLTGNADTATNVAWGGITSNPISVENVQITEVN